MKLGRYVGTKLQIEFEDRYGVTVVCRWVTLTLTVAITVLPYTAVAVFFLFLCCHLA